MYYEDWLHMLAAGGPIALDLDYHVRDVTAEGGLEPVPKAFCPYPTLFVEVRYHSATVLGYSALNTQQPR